MKSRIIDLKSRYKIERYEILKSLDKVSKVGHLVLTNELRNLKRNLRLQTKLLPWFNSGTDALGDVHGPRYRQRR